MPSNRCDETGGRKASQGRLIEAPTLSTSPWRQPVVWLGVLVFGASLGGCILMIALAMRLPEATAPAGVDYIMKVPVTRVPVAVDPPAPAVPRVGAAPP